MNNWLQRSELLFGKEAVKTLKNSRILLFGIGGVGSYALEALTRAGIGTLGLVDSDKVEETNLNRQLIATKDTIGKLKVDAARDRILSINPTAKVNTYPIYFDEGSQDKINITDYDYIIDAIDSVYSKTLLIQKAYEAKIPIISSMGTGNKVDPAKLEVADICKTEVCPLAKAMRSQLRKPGIKHLKCVYSKEIPLKTEENIIGSNSFVPATAGLLLASEVIKDLINLK